MVTKCDEMNVKTSLYVSVPPGFEDLVPDFLCSDSHPDLKERVLFISSYLSKILELIYL